MRVVAVSIAAWACMKNSNQSLHRTHCASVTGLAEQAPRQLLCAGELNR